MVFVKHPCFPLENGNGCLWFTLSGLELRILPPLELCSELESCISVNEPRVRQRHNVALEEACTSALIQQLRSAQAQTIACPEVHVASLHALHFSSQRAASIDVACLKIERRLEHVSIFKKPPTYQVCMSKVRDLEWCTPLYGPTQITRKPNNPRCVS